MEKNAKKYSEMENTGCTRSHKTRSNGTRIFRAKLRYPDMSTIEFQLEVKFKTKALKAFKRSKLSKRKLSSLSL